MIKLTWRTSRPVRRLVFDIENKPGTYGPGDFTHGKVVAIGWRFLGEDESRTQAICFNRRARARTVSQAKRFAKVWESADVVVGHNIKGHDLRLLDGFMATLDLSPLPYRRRIDTYKDMPGLRGMSRSLENLAARWGCPLEKVTMPEHVWEYAYDGVPEYVELMRRRVTVDVDINIWLYEELMRRGLLHVR